MNVQEFPKITVILRGYSYKQIRLIVSILVKMEEAKEAVNAGATFILSPIMLKKEILNFCKSKKVITVPGAFSPTEIIQSFRDGADIVKIFPADRLGKKYISDITAPLGELPVMVVGGINKENVNDYFKSGAKYAGIASGIFNKEDILSENAENLEKSLKDFINNLEI